MRNILYRNNEAWGAYVYDPVEIISYEIIEMSNTDIIEYCLDRYGSKFPDELTESLEYVIDCVENDNQWEGEDEIENIVVNLIRFLETNVFHTRIRYALWLASKKAVRELYDGTDDNISAYQTSPYILDDLGYDGILFGYPNRPVEIRK